MSSLTSVKFELKYERFNIDRTTPAKWEIITKVFYTERERELFIRRIADNVLVGRMWISKTI